jgi:hypothetical protein
LIVNGEPLNEHWCKRSLSLSLALFVCADSGLGPAFDWTSNRSQEPHSNDSIVNSPNGERKEPQIVAKGFGRGEEVDQASDVVLKEFGNRLQVGTRSLDRRGSVDLSSGQSECVSSRRLEFVEQIDFSVQK